MVNPYDTTFLSQFKQTDAKHFSHLINTTNHHTNYAFMDSWIKPKVSIYVYVQFLCFLNFKFLNILFWLLYIQPYKGQDFYKLKSQVAQSGGLFEDPIFPANNQSIGLKYLSKNKKLFPNGIRWLRPHVICYDCFKFLIF